MKFCVGYLNKGEVIKKYECNESEIIISYLDGSTYTLPLSDNNEKAILNLMLNQAKFLNGTY